PHPFGTRWLQAGGDIYKLSKILGHSSVAVTETHYAHLLKEDLVAASQQVKIPIAPRPGGNIVKLRPRRGAGKYGQAGVGAEGGTKLRRSSFGAASNQAGRRGSRSSLGSAQLTRVRN